jgi:ribose transport system permease protein
MSPRPLPRLSRSTVQELSLAAVIALVCIVFSLLSDRFADIDNLRNVVLQASPTVIAAVGMTFVIATRGIDLSVGSILNLALCTAVMFSGTRIEAELTTRTTWLVYPVALGAGMLLGMLNAQLIIRCKLSPLIATLGTLTLYRGLAQHLTSASLIAVSGPVLWFGRAQILSVGLPVIVAALTVLAGWLFLTRTVWGRQVLALGSSPRSAVETGIESARLLTLVYGLAGLCAAMAGLIVVGRVGVVNQDLGFGFEFTVITAVVLGGTSLFGGRASLLGSMMGAVLLTLVDNGLNLIGANPYLYDVVRGLVLVGAVSADAAARRARERRAAAVSV